MISGVSCRPCRWERDLEYGALAFGAFDIDGAARGLVEISVPLQGRLEHRRAPRIDLARGGASQPLTNPVL